MDTHEDVYRIVSRVLKVAEAELLPTTRFRSLPNADSMHMLQVILETENAFEIEIDADATFRIETIGDYELLVRELCNEAVAPSA